jgi:hypothetical protein
VRLSLCDSISISAGSHNDDRFGQHGAAAWVIDGSTDVLETRVLPGPSDAAWFADALNLALMRHATGPAQTLDAIVAAATAEVRAQFDGAALRAIVQPHERPSAAGILMRIADGHLEALSVGDCTLLALPQDRAPIDLFRPGSKRDADDDVRAAAAQARSERPASGQKGPHGIRAELMPMLRAKRDRMNAPGGYGAFSIEAPPMQHVSRVRRSVREGDLLLLATDGFMRLVDVYGVYSLPTLGEAIRTDGLARLAMALRKIELDDEDCRRFPRAKAMDDATAMIVRVIV